jgi:hypothetical protein
MKSFLDFNLLTNYSQLTNAHIVGYDNNQEVKIDFLTFGVGLYNYLQELESQYNFVTSDYETLPFDTSQISNLYLETGITNFSYIIEDQYLTLLPLSSGRVNLEYTQGLSGTRQNLNVGDYLFVKSLSTNQMYTFYYAATGSNMFSTSLGEDVDLHKKGRKWSYDINEDDRRPRINVRPPPKKGKSIIPIISHITWQPLCFGLGDDPDENYKYTAQLTFNVTLPRPQDGEFSKDLHGVKVIILNNLPDDIRFVDNFRNGRMLALNKGPGDVIECAVAIRRTDEAHVQPIKIRVITDAWRCDPGEASAIIPFPPLNEFLQSILGKEYVTVSGTINNGTEFSINLDTSSCYAQDSQAFFVNMTNAVSVAASIRVVAELNEDLTVTNKVKVTVSKPMSVGSPQAIHEIVISGPLNGVIDIPKVSGTGSMTARIQ